MRKVAKIVVVMTAVVFLSSQLAYARWQDAFGLRSSKQWWGRKVGSPVKNWVVKSAYHDTVRNKLGSAKWWTSSAWSKNAQHFMAQSVYRDRLRPTGHWIGDHKLKIVTGAILISGFLLAAVGGVVGFLPCLALIPALKKGSHTQKIAK